MKTSTAHQAQQVVCVVDWEISACEHKRAYARVKLSISGKEKETQAVKDGVVSALFHAVKAAFDEHGLLNPGKAVPTLHRCAEYGRMHVKSGQEKFADLPRY